MTTNTADKKTPINQASEVALEKFGDVADSAVSTMRDASAHYVTEPAKDIFGLLRDYVKDKPDVAAMWAFGLGIMVGWKLRG
jgi:hypothetical protein